METAATLYTIHTISYILLTRKSKITVLCRATSYKMKVYIASIVTHKKENKRGVQHLTVLLSFCIAKSKQQERWKKQ